ncbi:hypothetical protein ACHWQZ_G002845 [Mnemiopsis leidyi]
MLANEEEADEVIKVSNLVAKFESEIRRQTANERLIHTVRQVLRESRKVQKHPLQQHEGEDRSEYIFSTADVKPGPDQDLSACTDHPRVRTRVLQHNRFSQLKEKCSEIITKNVRNKSKPTPTPLVRPNSFSHNTNHLNRNGKSKSQSDRRATFNCNRQPKTYELKDVNDIGEGFEIINIDDCLSGDEDHVRRPTPQVELLDLSEKNTRNSRNRSVESLDSGCDIETPRANHLDKQIEVFQKLSLDDTDRTNTHFKTKSKSENLNEKVCSEMNADSNKSVRQKSDDLTKSIDVVCNIQVGADNTRISTQISTNSDVSQECFNNKHEKNLPYQKTESTQENDLSLDDTRSSEEDDDIPLQFNEIFKLFEPNKTPDENVSQYAEQLRTKLAWKLAAERVLQGRDTSSWTKSEDPRGCQLQEVKKPRKARSECPVYHDPELEDFISRCFEMTLPVQAQLTLIQESEESLMSCFVPKELHIPEMSEIDLLSIDSASLDSPSWSDGEYLDVND